MRYSIRYESALEFSQTVTEHQCELRIAPSSAPFQDVIYTQITTEPAVDIRGYVDAFGNRVHTFNVVAAHTRLRVSLSSQVHTRLENPFNFMPIPVMQEPAWLGDALLRDPFLWQYVLHRSSATPDVRSLSTPKVMPVWDRTRPLQDSLTELMQWTAELLQYETGSSDVHTALADVVRNRRGVCQDFTHLMIAVIRSWGVPARYVMGYMDAGVQEEAGMPSQATHAWAEVLLPGAGWRGFDATHGMAANDLYITAAVGRDYRDATPQRGCFKGNTVQQSPTVSLEMSRHAPAMLTAATAADQTNQ